MSEFAQYVPLTFVAGCVLSLPLIPLLRNAERHVGFVAGGLIFMGVVAFAVDVAMGAGVTSNVGGVAELPGSGSLLAAAIVHGLTIEGVFLAAAAALLVLSRQPRVGRR